MFQAIIEAFAGSVQENLLALIWYFVLFPIIWLASLPFILVIALFRREPYGYGFAVACLCTSVYEFWWKWGEWFVP
jgi:hypothetical protein